MPERGLLEDYVAQLSRLLPFGSGRKRRIEAEVAAHLDELKEHYIAAGIEPQEAEHRAIEQFGSAKVAAGLFQAEMDPKMWRSKIRTKAGLPVLVWACSRSVVQRSS